MNKKVYNIYKSIIIGWDSKMALCSCIIFFIFIFLYLIVLLDIYSHIRCEYYVLDFYERLVIYSLTDFSIEIFKNEHALTIIYNKYCSTLLCDPSLT